MAVSSVKQNEAGFYIGMTRIVLSLQFTCNMDATYRIASKITEIIYCLQAVLNAQKYSWMIDLNSSLNREN